MELFLQGAVRPALDISCDASTGTQLSATCLDAPMLPSSAPWAAVLGLEDDSIIPAEVATAVRVFLHQAQDIAMQCSSDSGEEFVAHIMLEIAAGDPFAHPPTFISLRIKPNVNFYSVLLPLKSGNFSIATSITSSSCPGLNTVEQPPVFITVASPQQLLAMQPHRVAMPVVDQIVFNACTAPAEFETCSGFTMHGDLGYVGPPQFALWTRHVAPNDPVVFFYQWGINKAPLFSNSTLKVLLAMESRAAETVMWHYIDSLKFDSPSPPFDYVLTHDRKLLQRAHPAPFMLLALLWTFTCCSAAGTRRALFVPHGGLLLKRDEVGLYRKTSMVSMVRTALAS
jgi:hypothetical protein